MVVYYSCEWFADGNNDPHWLYWWQWWQDCYNCSSEKNYKSYWIVPGTHDELED